MKSKISPTAWIALVVVAVAIVSLTLWTSSNRKVALPDSALSGSPATDAPPDMASRARPIAVEAPPLTAQEREARREVTQQAQKTVVEAGRNKLLNQFQSERVDGAWAAAKEQKLQTLSTSAQIEEMNARPKSMEVQCRSSVCVVTADFPTKLAADDWFTLYSLNVGPEMPTVSSQQTTNPDGSVRMELYGLAR